MCNPFCCPRFLSFFILATLCSYSYASNNFRAREVGVIPGYLPPGKWNAITDVKGVKVGQVTLIDADKNQYTGVTAILPHGENIYQSPVPAGYFRGNGYGKIMGTSQIIELGEIETPIVLTNTLNVADAAIGIIEWTLNYPGNDNVYSVNAVVGETNDGLLNDIRKRFVTKDHAIQAITSARSGPVSEGNVGAGTGTSAFGFKAGIGTSSRLLSESDGGYTVGVLVQANYGGDLHVLGVPIARLLKPIKSDNANPDGSIMVIVATDAPLSDRNLSRLAKRAILGIGRTGGTLSNGSGEYVLAFSTATDVRRKKMRKKGDSHQTVTDLANERMTPLFAAVIEATEEAVYNSLFMAKPVEGIKALPVETVVEILADHRQITQK